MTDVWLCVHGKRRLLPGIELLRGHLGKCPLRRGVVGEWAREIAGVALAPESILHQVHPLNQRIAVKFRSEQLIQLRKRSMKFRMIIPRLDVFEAAPPGKT